MIDNLKTRYVSVEIGIGTGQFGSGDPTKSTTYLFDSHRVHAHIAAYGGEMQGTASMRIFGLSNSLMNALTAIGPNHTQIRLGNSIKLYAGEDPAALTQIYEGTVSDSLGDYDSAPEVSMHIEAVSAVGAALMPSTPTPFNGVVTVDQVMRKLAAKMKYKYYNENVDKSFTLDSPTFNGSYLDQIKSCAYAVGIDWVIDGFMLKIKKQGTAFNGDPVIITPKPQSASERVLIGYPRLSYGGVTVRTLFSPAVTLGGTITIRDSIIAPANGDWIISGVVHELDGLTPHGRWFTTIDAYPNNLV